MRSLYPLLLTLLTIAPLSAQNWLPVAQSEMYHYRHEDSAFITHTIRIDSVREAGSDSIFYLNRVLARRAVNSNFTLLRFQGQFLGQEMVKQANGTIVFHAENLLSDTTLILRPQAGLGASWDAGEGLTATVTAVSTGSVLGEPDSLKTITFSNGAVWILSKRHGLVQVPDPDSDGVLELTGLEISGLGDRLYDFLDMFTFHVGDVFEHLGFYSGIGAQETVRLKRTILAREVNADTARYQVRQLRLREYEDDGVPATQASVDTVWWEFFRADLERINSYNNQLVELSPLSDFFLHVRLFPEGVRIGNESQDQDDSNCGLLTPHGDSLLALLDLLECVPSPQYYEEFREGLGRVHYEFLGLDNNIDEMLVGAYIQGDTVWGALTPDEQVVSTMQPVRAAPRLTVFPNPTTGPVAMVREDAGSPVFVEIFTADGHLIQRLRQIAAFDLSDRPAGVYLVRAQWEDGVQWGKVQKY